MRVSSRLSGPVAAVLFAAAVHADESAFPPWALVPPVVTLEFDYDPARTSQQNGAALEAVIENLHAGTRLEVGQGVYTMDGLFQIDLLGTAAAPIFITAKAGATPVLRRSDASQNTVNLGKSGAARHVALQGFEITGGDTALRLWNCENVWIDACRIHGCGGPGIEANTNDTAWLYITRNEVFDTAGNGEGLYLGGNNGSVVTHDSVVAYNHVHHTGGSQGDGIELKQGSWGNWIVGNEVHDTFYPGILVYGTGGKPRNLIERNTVYNSGDNTVQVQGEAVVRNNLIMNGNLLAFSSGNHQGQVRDLSVVHNTFVNWERAVFLTDWAGAPNMAFTNNAVYSGSAEAVQISGGSSGVVFSGNVAYGPVFGVSGGYTQGSGLADFVAVSWNASQRDARPRVAGALPGTGNLGWAATYDIDGGLRFGPLEAGCADGDDPGVTSYCTAGFSAAGCQATLSAQGQPSVSAPTGFLVAAAGLEGLKNGFFYYGANGRQSNPWGTGTSLQCVLPPVQRTPLQLGVGTPGACDGTLMLDLNAHWTVAPQAAPTAGQVLQLQLWYRDPLSTSSEQTSLSDALEFGVQP